MVNWVEKESGFWIGQVQGKTKCKISEHWSGVWLDGFGVPIVCGSISEAKNIAEDKLE